MSTKRLLFCSALVLMGVLDWVTTTIGIMFFGATETNPLIAGLTESNMLLFSVMKLFAVSTIGLTFYKAMGGTIGRVDGFSTRFVYSGYAVSLFTMTAMVANNIIATISIL